MTSKLELAEQGMAMREVADDLKNKGQWETIPILLAVDCYEALIADAFRKKTTISRLVDELIRKRATRSVQQSGMGHEDEMTPAAYAKSRGLARSTITRQIREGKIPTENGLVNAGRADQARRFNLSATGQQEQARRKLSGVSRRPRPYSRLQWWR